MAPVGRPRAFDPDQALDAVLDLFWARGYANASYDELVATSGVSRKSLYSVFGDKPSLFVRALERYRTAQGRAIFDALDAESIEIGDIRALIEKLGRMATRKEGAKGCFMANTAMDPVAVRPEVKAEINRHLAGMTARFAGALERAGVEPARVDGSAKYLTGAMQGLFLLARVRARKSLIDAYVAGVLARAS